MQGLKELQKSALANDKDVRRATPRLDEHTNKYARGSVLIFSNSFEWRGAMLLASYAANNALAALRTESGFVTVAAPKEILERASLRSPDFVIVELNGRMEHDIKAVAAVRHDVLVLGPGIRREGPGDELLKRLIALEKSMGNLLVIDAAMIGVIARNKRLIGSNMILTPHDGEFRTLTGVDLRGKPLSVRVREARKFAKKHGCTLVLKGHETVIADLKRLKINVSKTPALATMGSGDVLSGIIAGYAASHGEPFESAVAGVRAHSLAGDALFRKKGEHIIASDIIGAIPDVLKRFDSRR